MSENYSNPVCYWVSGWVIASVSGRLCHVPETNDKDARGWISKCLGMLLPLDPSVILFWSQGAQIITIILFKSFGGCEWITFSINIIVISFQEQYTPYRNLLINTSLIHPIHGEIPDPVFQWTPRMKDVTQCPEARKGQSQGSYRLYSPIRIKSTDLVST